MKRIAILLGLIVCTTAQALTADAFERVLRETAASETRTVTFFNGLNGLPDGSLDGAPLEEALRRGAVTDGGLLGAFLTGLHKLEKDGSKLILHRAEEITVDTGSGFIWLGKTVEIKIKKATPTEVKINDLEGAQAGRSAGGLHPIRTLKLSLNAEGLTTAKLNVGYALFNKSVEIVLKKAPPPTAGLATLVDGQ